MEMTKTKVRLEIIQPSGCGETNLFLNSPNHHITCKHGQLRTNKGLTSGTGGPQFNDSILATRNDNGLLHRNPNEEREVMC